ncbi:hypothetical protein C8F04DRAFT_1299357 [Mycena alexandri]|uniref:DUF6534 domain-containing protein n=1 Tax=Mycena alexandri TaxID=1745969 RepID=A0AAD6T959_9AGAR|nr:hypothetical protein C8F04DRAFT_1299357 [Mycena alexandri]
MEIDENSQWVSASSISSLTHFLYQPHVKAHRTLFDFFLFETLLIQIYMYRICFPKDSSAIKLLVYFVFFVDAICVVFDTLSVVVGLSAGDHTSFSQYPTPVLGSLSAMLVQLFYCFRIRAIRQTAWPIAVLIGIIAAAQFAAGVGWVILRRIGDNFDAKAPTILFYLCLVGDATADVGITHTMAVLLLKGSDLPQTRDAVKNIVRLIIETNALTSVLALLAVFLFALNPTGLDFSCPITILRGIYANTLLVVLNKRAVMYLRSESSDGLEEGCRTNTSERG